MIHFQPLPCESEALHNHGELFSRVAGLKRALRLVDSFGGGPASDVDDDLDAARFATAGPPLARCFDRRSEGAVASAAAGLDAFVGQRSLGREPNGVSLEVLAQDIRAGLADLSSLLRGPSTNQRR